MKRGLQIVLGVLSLIPLLFGGRNLLQGAGVFLSPEQVNAAIDSQFRFQSAYYMGLAFLIWFIIPNIEKHTAIFRLIILFLFIGGVGRLYSYVTIGAPPSNMIAGMVLELCLPLLIIWQARIAK